MHTKFRLFFEWSQGALAATGISLALLAAHVDHKPRLMFVGDSNTYGVTKPPSDVSGGFRPLVLKETGFQAVGPLCDFGPCAGYRGWTSKQLREKYDTWETTYHPDTVVIMAGTNDLLQGVPVEKAVRSVVMLASKPGCNVYVLPIPPINVRPSALRDSFNESLRNSLPQNAHWVETRDVLSGSDMACDGIHLLNEAYSRVGSRITDAINQQLG